MLSYIGGQAPWTSTSCSSWSSPKSFQSTDFLRNMNPTAMADLRKLLSRLNLVGYVVDAYIFWLSCLWGSTFRGHFLFVDIETLRTLPPNDVGRVVIVVIVVDVAAKRRRLPKCPFFSSDNKSQPTHSSSSLHFQCLATNYQGCSERQRHHLMKSFKPFFSHRS